MFTLKTKPGVNYAALNAAIAQQYPDWRGNVQICHAARRASDGSKYISIAVNPLRGFQLPPDARQNVAAMLPEVLP